MDSLRQKQNMEILDVFKDINSQVVGLTNRQVQAFPESLKPKTQRDLSVEVNVDKAVEHLNKVLEDKLGALEYVVQNISTSNTTELAEKGKEQLFAKSLASANNVGEAVPLWNSIVRSFQQQGLSRDSQNIVKVKLQELQPNLEALTYGLNQAVETILQTRNFHTIEGDYKSFLAIAVLDLLRTLSIYKTFKSQVDSGNLEMMSVELMNRAYSNIFDTLSPERLRLLKPATDRALHKNVIRDIPMFDGNSGKRVEALENELGFRIPVSLRLSLATASKEDFDRTAQQIRNEANTASSAFNKDEQGLFNEAFHTEQQLEGIQAKTRRVRDMGEKLIKQIRILESGEVPTAEGLIPVPEVGAEPEYFDYLFDEEEYKRLKRQYDEDLKAYHDAIDFNDWNLILKDFNDGSDARKREIIDELTYEATELENEFRRIIQEQVLLRDKITKVIYPKIAPLIAEREEVKRTGKSATQEAKRMEAVRKYIRNMRAKQQPPRSRGKVELPTAKLPEGYVYTQPDGRRFMINERGERVRVEDVADEKEELAGDGRHHKGRAVDTRGLASLRKNYGFESDKSESDESGSESSDEDPLQFDDSRNDMFSTKPYGYKKK